MNLPQVPSHLRRAPARSTRRTAALGTWRCAALLGLLLPTLAWGQDPEPPGEPNRPATLPRETQRAPALEAGAQRVEIDFSGAELGEVIKYFAALTDINLILDDPKNYRDTITIISNQPVSRYQALEAFRQALEMKGYTIVEIGGFHRVVKTDQAAQTPITVGRGGDIPYSSQFVTQIIPLENVSVGDVQQIVSSLLPPQAKVIAYPPSNTFIITDVAHNIRRVYQILQELDVAAPKSTMEIIPITFADATEIAQIIQELYPAEDSSAQQEAAQQRMTPAQRRRAARQRRQQQQQEASQDAVTAGSESPFISKVLPDERTNSLIVLANENGMEKVKELVAQLDVDVDLSSRAQIHVVYLEHAKAEDVAQVLSNLAQEAQQDQGARRPVRRTQDQEGDEETPRGAAAAFESGMKITHDENTNSLVVIASQEDFRVIKQVIDQLDVRRRQVFVDAVIIELSSDDSFEFGKAVHGPLNTGDNSLGIVGAGLGASSLGLSQDLLSGLAIGVFGESIQVPFGDGSLVPVPAFGIVLHALKSNSSVNVVSNPNLLTLDNEEAQIVVGRKIPFPTTSGLNNLGQPVVSFQREDVAITLQITPRVNSSNYVTLELLVEVQEISEDNRGLNVNQAGFITERREVESTILARDNQTVVLGGLMSSTDSEVETKIPILGDIPLIGALFRGSRTTARKTNLMVFLTPHIIDDEDDMLEIMTVKEAQRQEFLRRFYGRSRDEQIEQIKDLMQHSMNHVDRPSVYKGPDTRVEELDLELDEAPLVGPEEPPEPEIDLDEPATGEEL